MTELTKELLEQLKAEDAHGLLTPETKPEPVTNADILANRFEEINAFIDTHDRRPDPDNRDDIGEFQLGHRLQAILDNSEYRSALEHLDRHELLAGTEEAESIEDLLAGDTDLLSGLLDPEAADLFDLKHVPPPSKESPDKVAQGEPCEDFDQFEPLFAMCHADIRLGRRKLEKFQNPKYIEQGKFYVQRGVLVYVAEVGELTQKPKGLDGRLRCIYENGTESDLLLHSLARGLYDGGKTVTEPEDVIHQRFEIGDHQRTGYVYVARTHSDNPQLVKFKHLHKIGYTTNEPEGRVAAAANDATFLNALASLVDSYEMPAEYAKKVETLLHAFFSEVRLDVWYENGPSAREWFDVPRDAIAEAIELIGTEQLNNYRYNPLTERIDLS